MAKSNIPRRKGDDYQVRFFWLKLLEMRTGNHIESVTFESDEISFVDDVVVSYGEPIKDPQTGKQIIRDLFQYKYHITQNNAFTHENLIDPKFINGKTSMLERLYNAYVDLLKELDSDAFRLYIVSIWDWDHRDVLADHLQEKEMIRATFYEKGPRSKRGKARTKLADHLGIPEEDLQAFLNTVRFKLGKNLADLTKELSVLLKYQNLKQIDPQVTHNVYDDLAWKLFAQGRQLFNKQSLNALIREEKLIVLPSTEHSEISIRSFSELARPQHDSQASYLDLCHFFDGRFPKDDSYWEKEIPERISAFMLNENLVNVPQPIHIFFDCHLSIAFLAGSMSSPKHRVQIIPTQQGELWEQNAIDTDTSLWDLQNVGEIGEEWVLGISVTHQVQKEMEPYLEVQGLSDLPQILVQPIGGTDPKAVPDGNHAWLLGYQLAKQLREILCNECRKIHIFFAVPVALGYILGHTLRHVVPSIQLYEHDFEGQRYKHRYYPSLRIPYQP